MSEDTTRTKVCTDSTKVRLLASVVASTPRAASPINSLDAVSPAILDVCNSCDGASSGISTAVSSVCVIRRISIKVELNESTNVVLDNGEFWSH